MLRQERYEGGSWTGKRHFRLRGPSPWSLGRWQPLRAWGKGLVMARTKIRIIDHSVPIFFPFLVTLFLCGGAFLANKLFGK